MSGPKDQLDQVRHPDTTAVDLERLSRSPYNFVLTAVAAHPRAPATVLARLVPDNLESDPDQALAKAIAWNPSTDAATLDRLARVLSGHLNSGRGNQVAFAAGVALFARFDTDSATLIALLDDETTSTEFRKVVAHQAGRPDVIERLRRDRSERVRRTVGSTAP